MNSNMCVGSATSLTCTFSNNLKGSTDSTLTCSAQYPLGFEINSEIKLNFSSNWDLSTVTPSLTTSSPSMTMGAVTSASGSFDNYIDLTLGASTSASETISFTIAVKNPTSDALASSDFQIEYYDTLDALRALSNPYSAGHTMSCQTGCATCSLTFDNCTSCSTNYEFISSKCIPLPDSQTTTWGNDYKGHETSSLT